MQEPGKEWEDVLFWATPQVNSWRIEHLAISLSRLILEYSHLHLLNVKFKSICYLLS